MTLKYPKTQRKDSKRIYKFEEKDEQDVSINDPYEYLENETKLQKDWINEQKELFNDYITEYKQRDIINNVITKTFNYKKISCPFYKGRNNLERLYYYKNDGLQNHSILYSKKNIDTNDDDGKVVIDPNKFSKDGTISLAGCTFSKSGKYLAYKVSKNGSDWQTIYVKDLENDKILNNDVLEWIKFSSISWLQDNSGFFYCRYDKPKDLTNNDTSANKLSNQKLFFHKIGTKQSDDLFIYEDLDNPKWMVGPEVTDCGKYLLLYISPDCDPVNRVYCSSLNLFNQNNGYKFNFSKLIDNFDASYDYITNVDDVFYFQSNLKAPLYKLISAKVNLDNNSLDDMTDILPESKNKQVLSWVKLVNKKFLLACVRVDVKDKFLLYDLNGKLVKEDFKFPMPGCIVSVSGRNDDEVIFYKFASYGCPGNIYMHDFKENETKLHKEVKVAGFKADDYTLEQVFYPSKDGTKIPMYIFYHKDTVKDGNNPTMLYGYGGFNISLLPSFSPRIVSFLRVFKGIYCVANLRGGSEYGRDWHDEGCLLKKQNVFDDFNYAAKYLTAQKYTNPEKLAIYGGSNGGLLTAACANEQINAKTDLFRCVISECAVLDMLRFSTWTIGYAWESDYGRVKVKKEFDALLAYSPVHNVNNKEIQKKLGNEDKASIYPATLLICASHDDRVVPYHSYKYISELQHQQTKEKAQNDDNPCLIRIDTKTGHSAGRSTVKQIETQTDLLSFVAKTLKLTVYDA